MFISTNAIFLKDNYVMSNKTRSEAFTLLDYRDQFMGRLYIVDCRSRTQGTGMQLTLYKGMLSQLQNWVLKNLVLSYGSQWFPLKLMYLDDIVYKGWIGSQFTCVHKVILVITQGCIGVSE